MFRIQQEARSEERVARSEKREEATGGLPFE
jgi:hypothetical protein